MSLPLFCSLFNNVVMPSQLPMGADMHLFRDGIAPKVRFKWKELREHREGRSGGAMPPQARDERRSRWSRGVPRTSSLEPVLSGRSSLAPPVDAARVAPRTGGG